MIWRLEQDRYALTESKLYHLGEQLSDLYGGDPHTVGYKRLEQIRGEAANLFLETDMFFVKVSYAASLTIYCSHTDRSKGDRFPQYRPINPSSSGSQNFHLLPRTSRK